MGPPIQQNLRQHFHPAQGVGSLAGTEDVNLGRALSRKPKYNRESIASGPASLHWSLNGPIQNIKSTTLFCHEARFRLLGALGAVIVLLGCKATGINFFPEMRELWAMEAMPGTWLVNTT